MVDIEGKEKFQITERQRLLLEGLEFAMGMAESKLVLLQRAYTDALDDAATGLGLDPKSKNFAFIPETREFIYIGKEEDERSSTEDGSEEGNRPDGNSGQLTH